MCRRSGLGLPIQWSSAESCPRCCYSATACRGGILVSVCDIWAAACMHVYFRNYREAGGKEKRKATTPPTFVLRYLLGFCSAEEGMGRLPATASPLRVSQPRRKQEPHGWYSVQHVLCCTVVVWPGLAYSVTLAAMACVSLASQSTRASWAILALIPSTTARRHG